MHFHLAATFAKAIKVLPVLAAVMAFSLLPPAPDAAAQSWGSWVGPSGTYTAYPIQSLVPDLVVETNKVYGYYGGNETTQACPGSTGRDMFYYVRVTVGNKGGIQSNPTQLLVMYQDCIMRIAVPSIQASGEHKTDIIYFFDRASDPRNFLWIQVDPGNLVKEHKENNNLTLGEWHCEKDLGGGYLIFVLCP